MTVAGAVFSTATREAAIGFDPSSAVSGRQSKFQILCSRDGRIAGGDASHHAK